MMVGPNSGNTTLSKNLNLKKSGSGSSDAKKRLDPDPDARFDLDKISVCASGRGWVHYGWLVGVFAV